jgi:hypothetical protein
MEKELKKVKRKNYKKPLKKINVECKLAKVQARQICFKAWALKMSFETG